MISWIICWTGIHQHHLTDNLTHDLSPMRGEWYTLGCYCVHTDRAQSADELNAFVQADKGFVDTLAHIRSGKCGLKQLRDLEAQCSSSLDMSDGILPTVVCPSEAGQAMRLYLSRVYLTRPWTGLHLHFWK